MIKHLLTSKCTRDCSYCISGNVKLEQNNNLEAVLVLYDSLVNVSKITEIMLTGGEPMLANYFWQISYAAFMKFKSVFITTQNPEILSDSTAAKAFKAITFSLHDKNIPAVTSNAVVYASILDHYYYPQLPEVLKNKGYAGLTINENQFSKEFFTEDLPELESFSIKINRRGKCLNDPVILPDLSIAPNFTKYLNSN